MALIRAATEWSERRVVRLEGSREGGATRKARKQHYSVRRAIVGIFTSFREEQEALQVQVKQLMLLQQQFHLARSAVVQSSPNYHFEQSTVNVSLRVRLASK